jgi:GNAT superfamily N-acetyltransferase
MKVKVRQVRELPLAALAPLINEGEAAGFHFLTKLRDDWLSGKNSFDQPGEAFFVAEVDGQLVGVCGLNRNPYDPDSRTGRVRRLYVARAYRWQGIAGQLVSRVIRAAAGHFDELELRTKTEEASEFYQNLGFLPVGRAHATHAFRLS